MCVSIALLNAEPSLAQVKQAVAQNPAILESPQAKAMMQEKGVTLDEVKQKLAQDGTSSNSSEVANEQVDNNVDTTLEESQDTKKELTTDLKNNALAKRVNPFAYKNNAQIRKELQSKQQKLNPKKLTRYSMSFYANKNTIDASSLPTPDNYMVSTGDVISIHVYGDRDKNYNLEVKNDRSVELDFIGPVVVGGMSFKEAKRTLKAELQAHYQMSEFSIKIAKYTTIQVTLVGDVKYPGIYNLSSFSTVKDLLITAKGVRKSASVRDIVIRRNGRTIAHLDFYELLFKGNRFGTKLLKQGDIVIIKKAKKLVSIDGYVKNAAIFELKDGESLYTLINYAGGMKPDASKANIKVDRYSKNSKFETYKLSFAKSKRFAMQDGDKVYVYPLDFTAKQSINVYGNIIRPGSYRLNKSRTLNEFFKESLKGGLKSFFLPQTYFKYGVIKRYKDDLTYSSISFNLADVINGDETVNIKANDEVFIFSKNDIFTNTYITTKGDSLINPGKLQYFAGMSIKDAINASGISSINGILDDKVKVTTFNTKDFMPQTKFYSLKNEGDTRLSPYDEVEVYDYYAKHILEPVSISGEVVKPTQAFYEDGMTLKRLLDMAGGFNKKAYTKSLSITRYYVDDTQTRQQKVLNINLEETALEDIMLEPYDEVRVSTILGWGAQDYTTVAISGEVHNPLKVKYGNGMSVQDLIIMSGGLTKRAYMQKIEIVRYYLDKEQNRQRDILSIDIDGKDLSKIALEPYDEVKIFTIPNWSERRVVTLRGEVRFPGTYVIDKGEKLSSVLKRAGGFTNEAFIEGTVFTRESVRKNQIEQYNTALAKIKRQLAIYNAMPANAKEASGVAQSSGALNEVIMEAKKYQPVGRVSISLDRNISKIQESEYNLVLKDKDTITIPTQIDTVTVFGEVFNPTSFVYNSSYNIDDFIKPVSYKDLTVPAN
jgi:protein involved in polysaccharide export with SLBB domain